MSIYDIYKLTLKRGVNKKGSNLDNLDFKAYLFRS